MVITLESVPYVEVYTCKHSTSSVCQKDDLSLRERNKSPVQWKTSLRSAQSWSWSPGYSAVVGGHHLRGQIGILLTFPVCVRVCVITSFYNMGREFNTQHSCVVSVSSFEIKSFESSCRLQQKCVPLVMCQARYIYTTTIPAVSGWQWWSTVSVVRPRICGKAMG